MRFPRETDLLDWCFMPKDGIPGRAPLELDQIFWMLTSPGPRTPRHEVILKHPYNQKQLLFFPLADSYYLHCRAKDRLVVGHGAFGRRAENPPAFCPKCSCLVKDFKEVLAHVFDAQLRPIRSMECHAMQATMRALTLAMIQEPAYDSKVAILYNQQYYYAPLTPEMLAEKLGDFAEWLKHCLLTQPQLHHCPLCSCTMRTHTERDRHGTQAHGLTKPMPGWPAKLVKAPGVFVKALAPADPLLLNDRSFKNLVRWATLIWQWEIYCFSQRLGIHTFLFRTIKAISQDVDVLMVTNILGDSLHSDWKCIGALHYELSCRRPRRFGSI